MKILATTIMDMSGMSEVFYHGTKCCFYSTMEPEREPDYVSESGSTYWYEPYGVYRLADHWGRDIGSNDWSIGGYAGSSWDFDGEQGALCGFASWSDFTLKESTIPLFNPKWEGEAAYVGDIEVSMMDISDGSMQIGELLYTFEWNDEFDRWEGIALDGGTQYVEGW